VLKNKGTNKTSKVAPVLKSKGTTKTSKVALLLKNKRTTKTCKIAPILKNEGHEQLFQPTDNFDRIVPDSIRIRAGLIVSDQSYRPRQYNYGLGDNTVSGKPRSPGHN
jgi:hypothetical protein